MVVAINYSNIIRTPVPFPVSFFSRYGLSDLEKKIILESIVMVHMGVT